MKFLKCSRCDHTTDYEVSKVYCLKDGCQGVYQIKRSTRKQEDPAKAEKKRVENFKIMFGEDIYEEAFVCSVCGYEDGIGYYKINTNAKSDKGMELETEFKCEDCQLIIQKEFEDGTLVSGSTRPVRESDG